MAPEDKRTVDKNSCLESGVYVLKDELEHALFYASPFPWRIAGNKILSANGEIVCEVNSSLDPKRIQANLDLICELREFLREREHLEACLQSMEAELISLEFQLRDALGDEL